MAKLKLKSGDTVRVIAGDHKGKEGKITKVLIEANKAIVEGVNLVSKHTKPSAQNPQGGIVKKEAALPISNLALVVDGETTRVGYRTEDGKKVTHVGGGWSCAGRCFVAHLGFACGACPYAAFFGAFADGQRLDWCGAQYREPLAHACGYGVPAFALAHHG